jgi:serine/threonine-protein kinase HipA
VILLAVWVTLPDGENVSVGELACSDPDGGGTFKSEFEYAAGWLQHRQRFPLDPLSLPLRRGRFPAKNLDPPLAVFDDALPDDWGRALVIRGRQLSRSQQGIPFLLRELADHPRASVGALRFVANGGQPMSGETAGLIDLAKLAAAADAFEAGLAADPYGLQLLFAAGSSLGGARPKVLVDDRERHWIAKFPSAKRDGRFDIVGLEAVGLDLATEAGLSVPVHKLQTLGGTNRRALLVERFDTTGVGGRRHMISLRTLCKERPGIYAQTYSELAEVVRQVSAEPQHDVDRFFRQMVFNAAYGNTDDHLKNFWMVHDRAGYRLSEAFDLLPDVAERREHTLAFEHDHGAPSRAEMVALADRWNVNSAVTIMDDVLESVSNFQAVANARGVPTSNIDEIEADVIRRTKRLR